MILSLLFAKPNTSQLTLMNYNHNSWKSLDLIKESNLWVSLIPNIINEPTLERSKYDQIYNKTINDTIDAKQINSTGMYSVDGNHQIHRISQRMPNNCCQSPYTYHSLDLTISILISWPACLL